MQIKEIKWDETDRIIYDSEKQLITIVKDSEGGCSEWGRGETDTELNLWTGYLFKYNRSGIFVQHVVHHVPQNAKLQSVAERQNLVQEFCYFVRVPWKCVKTQQNWGTERTQISTKTLELLQ